MDAKVRTLNRWRRALAIARALFEDAGYHTLYLDEIEAYVGAGGRIDPTQALLWPLLGGQPVTAADVERFGVEFITTHDRLRQIRSRYPCPTVIDIGNGVFGAKVGLLFIDDETGRAIAYAPPQAQRPAGNAGLDATRRVAPH